MIEALNELDLVVARPRRPPAGPRSRTTRSRSARASRCRSRGARSTSTRCATRRASRGRARRAGDDASTPRSRAAARVPRRDGDARRRSPRCAASGRRRRCSARSPRGSTPTPITMVPGVARPARPARSYDRFVDAPVAVGMPRRPATVGLRRHAPTRAPRSRTPPGCGARRRRRWPRSSWSAAARSPRGSCSPTRRHADRPRQRAGGTVIGTAAGAAHRGRPRRRRRRRARAAAPAATRSPASARRSPPGARAAARQPGRRSCAGQTVVLRLPNARRDVGRRRSGRSSACAARRRASSLLANGGDVLADAVAGRGDDGAASRSPRAPSASSSIGQGDAARRAARATGDAGLAGWHAGMQLPYVGWSTALGAGLRGAHVGERARRTTASGVDAGWVGGAELARGAEHGHDPLRRPRHAPCVVVLDDPAAFGGVGRRAPAAARARRRRPARPTPPAPSARRCC